MPDDDDVRFIVRDGPIGLHLLLLLLLLLFKISTYARCRVTYDPFFILHSLTNIIVAFKSKELRDP
jgi:hypothetical protein